MDEINAYRSAAATGSINESVIPTKTESLPQGLNPQGEASIGDSQNLGSKRNVFQSLKSGSSKILGKLGKLAAKHPLAITGVAAAVGGVALMGACLLLGGPAGVVVGGAILGLAGGAMIGANFLGSSAKKDTAANAQNTSKKQDTDVTEGLPKLGPPPDLFGSSASTNDGRLRVASEEPSSSDSLQEPEKEVESASQPDLMSHIDGAGRALMVSQGSLLGNTSAKYSARTSTPKNIVTDRQGIDNDSISIKSRRAEVEALLDKTSSSSTDTKRASVENTRSTKSGQSAEQELKLPPLPPRDPPPPPPPIGGPPKPPPLPKSKEPSQAAVRSSSTGKKTASVENAPSRLEPELPPLPPRDPPPPPPPIGGPPKPPPLPMRKEPSQAAFKSSRSKEGDVPRKSTEAQDNLAALTAERLRQRRAHLEDEESEEIAAGLTGEETTEMTQASKAEDVQDASDVKARPDRGRSDLLKAIQQGANLRHVDASKNEKPAADAGSQSMGDAMLEQMKKKGFIPEEEPSAEEDEEWEV